MRFTFHELEVGDDWNEFRGFVPANVMDKVLSRVNTVVITRCLPIMIKFVIRNLYEIGFTDEQIYTTIEDGMKCGMWLNCAVVPAQVARCQ
ncbi:MAG TPA: hypothetical protein VMW07_07050 [Gallionella sp.]|nr:hypothetical protein [Gallionella sp.]